MYKLYPNARRAHLKTGGNFPYLCRSAEVNLYIQVSLCVPSRSANARSWSGGGRLAFCACSRFVACRSAVCSGSWLADTERQGWAQARLWRAGFGVWLLPFPLSSFWTLVLQSHDFILTKITWKECFPLTKTLRFYAWFSVVFCVRQIHLLQFHGTRYAAIDPAMVSAEELEVQKISLHASHEQDEQ